MSFDPERFIYNEDSSVIISDMTIEFVKGLFVLASAFTFIILFRDYVDL